MDEAPAEAVVGVVGDSKAELVTKRDLEFAVAQLTAELHRALRVQGMWVVGMVAGFSTIMAAIASIVIMLAG